ncbi:hypothetical protein GPALN_014847 [Globodera pallida]|nr:hypothetical protein GPALN_014847 [Globodera pallida]
MSRYARIFGLRKIYFYFLLLLNLSIFIVWYEETNYGSLINWYGNFYRHIVYRQIYANRSDLLDGHRLNISVVVVVNNGEQLQKEYTLAHRTVRCYCALHAYPLTVIDLDHWRYRDECPQQDFMFRRHCALAKWLSMNPSIQYALFVDADMGVINPNHLLEHFLANFEANLPRGSFDLIFYERIFNAEIMAGSYWAKNSRFTIEMLHYWANFSVPSRNPFRGGTDNGAIHAVFLDIICGPQCSELGARCLDLWADARHFGELRPFELCVRAILGARQQFRIDPDTSGLKLHLGGDNGAGRVLLVTDFRQYWSRDGWLTGNQWSPRDFLLHGWQLRRMDQPTFARWHSPLTLSTRSPNGNFDINCANAKNASLHWPFKESFMLSESEIDAKIGAIVKRRRQDDLKVLTPILA